MSDLLKLCDELEGWCSLVSAARPGAVYEANKLCALVKAARAMFEAHKLNANEDYRGNRSSESQRSFKAMSEADRIARGEE